ncbi:IS66 family insertion sequence element accessory protein TnpB [Roseomonas soli]|uniref:IS66 family insertion sequence element accessory protein TnpB n=1 Tax=Neoroseomonas soli TaxID=1081025 RepID=A0A9X9X347_9PROT|nr:IS66 family insertion sequence element accessory protein TnpB [Neoroseomonas soli]
MLSLHAGMRVHLALGATDMRKGFDGLAAQVQTVLKADPFSGHLFLFRGRRGDLLKALWWDGQGLVLLAKRLEKGRFIWPTIAREGTVTLTTAQLAMLLEGLDWRTPMPSWKPEIAVSGAARRPPPAASGMRRPLTASRSAPGRCHPRAGS